MKRINARSWDAAIRAVQANLLELPAHLPVSAEQDRMLAAVYTLCECLTAKKSLPTAVPVNRELARKYGVSLRTVTNWRREGCPFDEGQWRVLDWMHERRYLPRRAEQRFSRQLKRRAWSQFGNAATLLNRLSTGTVPQNEAAVLAACVLMDKAIRKTKRMEIETVRDLRRAVEISTL